MEVKRPTIGLTMSPYVGFMEQARNYSESLLGPNMLRSNDLKGETFLSPAQFGCLTGMLIIMISYYQLDKDKCLSRLWFLLKSPSIKEFIFVTTCFLVSLLFMPTTFLIFALFRLYKEVDGIKLRRDKTAGFKGFMNGEDIVWACEDAVSKSIINVLAFVRSSPKSDDDLPVSLLQSIRDRIYTKLVQTNRFPKLFYRRRKSDSGYFYWTDENHLTVEDYVRFSRQQKVEQVQSEDEFKRELSETSNDPLPADNTALWECLISQRAIRVGDDKKYAVVFRVHHSLGDGVALLRLLLETLADKVDFDVAEGNPLLSNMTEDFQRKLMRYGINLMTFFKAPAMLFKMALKEIDVNRIHPEKTTGNKKINWLYESEPRGNYPTLLTIVKLLKRQFDSGRFSNILLAALSKSLKDFFERKNYEIPKDMTVVIPARLYNMQEDPRLEMQNKFSVALQTLPIDVKKIDDRIMKIKQYSEIVNASPDYLVNFWMMSIVGAVFPERILKVILNSKHSTMAVSNLPGPNFAIKINGHEFENVGFFLPNIGQTACGITILSYNNRLHFGIMADEAAIGNEDDLGEVLEGMVREIEVMMKNVLM